MKYILMMVLCHGVDCTPPIEWPVKFNSYYDCAITGYDASILKMQELGPDKVNENKSTILFACQESSEI